MALIKINNLDKIVKERNSIHKETSATYNVFKINSKLYFQIDTYGSEDRKEKGKVSQCLQLDRETGIELISIIKKELCIE